MCIRDSYRMKGFLTVHEMEEYQAWLDEEQEYLQEQGDDDDWGDDEW